MNKQELIEKYKNYENELYDIGAKVACKHFLKDLEQLDETQKVTIPQFVADWIEVCKEHLTTSLYTAMNPNFMKENNQSFDLILWIKKTNNQETFARAWMDGYEVEKEKRYRVKIKGEIEENLLVYGFGVKRYFFARTYDSSKREEHTRKELEEADFGWVFDCPGIEIEEVED
nr:MAG TPA: Protein of unknown function (DUF1642) [Caudoviricetes sp.]